VASITIRQLDEALKQRLRLRAAQNGRSMEDEVRVLLRDAAEGESTQIEKSARDTKTASSKSRGKRTEPSADTTRVLLVIGGGIAAYKSLDLIRRLRERHMHVRVILTKAAQQFITPLSAGAIAGERVFTDLFDADGEFDVGHIRLAREADLIIVAPATADLMAKLANGHADDLATAVLLATGAKVLLAPAMNPHMWANKATQRNRARLEADGFAFIGPNDGEMAESGERGKGRMAEPLEIAGAVEKLLAAPSERPLAGKLNKLRVVITSGPTHEPIDPVRYIANRSSGKQGHAIAAAAAAAGADVTLISGPVTLPDPAGVSVIRVESARDMLAAVEKALPADIAIFAAAVADWRVKDAGSQKIKKAPGARTPELALIENPDILSTVAHRTKQRPKLVIGFAAETQNVVANAQKKLQSKACDWIVANDVSPQTGIMGGDSNTVMLVSAQGVENWPPQSKEDVARMLVARIAQTVGEKKKT
jgi:phosphopantothenoylcysteine decarboxylase/phosphopantothenate--cysteine ligase